MNYKHLLIVSDTRMHLVNGEYFAFNSVVSELAVFVKLFETITWIGFDHSDESMDSTLLKMEYPQVKMILKPRSGGSSIKAKLNIVYHLFSYLKVIFQEARKANVVHSRGPTGPMFLALIVSFIYRKPIWWFKYANNWNDSHAPFFWSLQRKMMIKNTASFGTVNGSWPNMPKHILAFENPCLDVIPNEAELLKRKEFNPKLKLLFVGRIEDKKGYSLILESIKSIPKERLESLVFIGNGPDEQLLIEQISSHPYSDQLFYLGAQSKKAVFKAMLEAQFLLLPTSSSEGFPKVIAEAWCNGCVPIVMDISSIGQYVQDEVNGFICPTGDEITYAAMLKKILELDSARYFELVKSGLSQCHLFTYEHFEYRIKERIVSKVLAV